MGPGFVVYERAPGQYGYDLKMAKGSVGKGWHLLLEAFFQAVEHDKTWNPNSGFAHAVVTQVKEKYGVLCIYFNSIGTQHGGYDRVEGFVDALCSMSSRFCEACGQAGETRDRRFHILTLCDKCNDMPPAELRLLLSETEQTE